MSVQYVPIQWNRFKIVFDLFALAAIALYINLFLWVGRRLHVGAEAIDDTILQMRAYGTCAFLLLHFILLIGPLARLDRRFLPILYNRRHLGVMMFAVAMAHAYHVLSWYHSYGEEHPLVALFTYDTAFTPVSVPFQLFGVVALLIFFIMAATSHDFWQAALGPRAWKSLHMLVYVAYGSLVVHVGYGGLRGQTHWAYGVLLLVGVAVVGTLHVVAGSREGRRDQNRAPTAEAPPAEMAPPWIDAGPAHTIRNLRARGVHAPSGERIAVVRTDDRVSAVHGVCAHQLGPLAEGKVIDGCLTCPWHGWNYRPEDGRSPPPFEERLATYRVKLDRRGHVWVDPRPLPPGTPTEPVQIGDSSGE